MKKKIDVCTQELFSKTDIEALPVLLSKSKVHDSIAIMAKSCVMAGQHMRNAAADMNMKFKVKIRKRGFRITKKVMWYGRNWKKIKAKNMHDLR